MLENPIFQYSSEFVSDDSSNFLDEYARVLMAIQNYYNNLVTTASVALLQVTVFEYLFIIDTHEGHFDILKVNINNCDVKLVAQFNKLVSSDEQE